MVSIAIVEHDVALLDSMQLLFHTEGWFSDGYTSGNAFLQATHDGVDCLLVESHLPDMTGLELLRTLRALPFPAIGLTTRPHSPVSKAMTELATKVLAQPVTASDLIDEISAVLAASSVECRVRGAADWVGPKTR